jgi:hypothetical protein
VTDQTLLDVPDRVTYSSKIAKLRSGYVSLQTYHLAWQTAHCVIAVTPKRRYPTSSYSALNLKMREKDCVDIFKTCVVGTLAEELLLGVGSDDPQPDYRTDVNTLLGKFLAQSKHM